MFKYVDLGIQWNSINGLNSIKESQKRDRNISRNEF